MSHTTGAVAKGLKGTLLIVFGVLTALGIVEGSMRLYYMLYPSTARGFFWRPSQLYGWEHIPNREGIWYDDHGEFRAHVRINSRGLRDIEHEYTKTSGIFRILVLGDSYMEGVQVELESLFARRLESDLVEGGSVPVEVINAGVADFGTDQELLLLREEGLRYEPDLVLLGFTVANDVRNNYEPLNLRVPIGSKMKPVFSLGRSGELELRPAPPQPPPLPWWHALHVGRTIAEQLGWRPPAPAAIRPVAPGANSAEAAYGGLPVDALIYKPEPLAEVDAAWQLTFALLRAMRTDASFHRARLAVFVISGPWVHYPDEWKLLMSASPVARDTWDPRLPNRTLSRFLEQEGIAGLDLAEAFDVAAREDGALFFKADKHWTVRGHHAAARAVASFLLARGIVPRAERSLRSDMLERGPGS